GIIDVFSFAHELPYRIELFGDEVDSIRSFDPGSQISVEECPQINIIPNVQTKLIQEERQSFLEFISPDSLIFIKDAELAGDVIQQSFDKASLSFSKTLKQSGAQVVSEPDKLFDTLAHFMQSLERFSRVEFGSRNLYTASASFEFSSSAQPSFNKNFELLAQNLIDHQEKDFQNFIASDVP